MTSTDIPTRKRTGWIWAISLFYVFSAGWTLISYYLVFTKAVQITQAQAAYFDSLSSFDFYLSIAILLANFTGAVALFFLRRLAFYLFAAALSTSIVLTIWHALSKGWVQALGASGLAGAILGFCLSIAICFYAWKLKKRNVLI